jgi:hypothetical protein
VLRLPERSESLRDPGTTILETNLSLQDHRLTVVIKKLTSWAATIAVPTAITGFFRPERRVRRRGRLVQAHAERAAHRLHGARALPAVPQPRPDLTG